MSTTGRKKGEITMCSFFCKECEKLVIKRESDAGYKRFCSRICAANWGVKNSQKESTKVSVICSGCEEPLLIWKHEAEKNKKHFHNYDCRRLYNKKTPSVSIDKLRDLVWERDSGVCIDCGSVKYLQTHHIDGDRKHNVLDNLVLLCKLCHVKRHIFMENGLTPSGKVCQKYTITPT